ncbi:MAG: sodium/solute symporter [Acidobacteriota bacterium]
MINITQQGAGMNLQVMDILIFLIFFAVVVGVSLFKSRREKSSEDYFLAGRGLSWPFIGLSIVAANISTEQFVGMSGQGAGSTGLAVSNWQLIGSIGIVLIAFTLLPRFLRSGIYTMPEFLEYRYNSTARAIMALLTVLIYVGVLLTGVLYSGGLTLQTIFGMDLVQAVWLIGIIATIYTAFGGLKAIVWADLFQGGALIFGGLFTFWIGLQACGGWETFAAINADKLHMILPANHDTLPWTGVAAGMWIVLIYYCGLNQFIVQRNLAARTMRDGQLGVIFAGALWLVVPFAIVMPGIMASQLYPDQVAANPDSAYPTLIRELVGPGVRGLMFAAIAGAVISSLASLLNSASTIFTMDIYHRMFDRDAPQKRLLLLGRALTIVFVTTGCLAAPLLAKNESVFQFIQQFQGYIWPGVVAAFLVGFLVPRAPGAAGVTGLAGGPVLYGFFQFFTRQGFFAEFSGEALFQMNFLVQVLLSFLVLFLIMGIITLIKPLPGPRKLPVRAGMELETSPVVKIAGAAVIIWIIVFYIVFW